MRHNFAVVAICFACVASLPLNLRMRKSNPRIGKLSAKDDPALLDAAGVVRSPTDLIPVEEVVPMLMRAVQRYALWVPHFLTLLPCIYSSKLRSMPPKHRTVYRNDYPTVNSGLGTVFAWSTDLYRGACGSSTDAFIAFIGMSPFRQCLNSPAFKVC